jgi:hypothetical protein
MESYMTSEMKEDVRIAEELVAQKNELEERIRLDQETENG